MMAYVFIALQIAGTKYPESNFYRKDWSIMVAEAMEQQLEVAGHVDPQSGARWMLLLSCLSPLYKFRAPPCGPVLPTGKECLPTPFITCQKLIQLMYLIVLDLVKVTITLTMQVVKYMK